MEEEMAIVKDVQYLQARASFIATTSLLLLRRFRNKARLQKLRAELKEWLVSHKGT